MKVLCVDAFADVRGGGNPAGVVFIDSPLTDAKMLSVAAKVGYSETAFLTKNGGGYDIRYFTPVDEVELCGHATVASFAALLSRGEVCEGASCKLYTKSGEINVDIQDGLVWLDMASPREVGELNSADTDELYAAFSAKRGALALLPAIVNTGLPDIMMPVADEAALAALSPDMGAITALSKRHGVTGVHAFTASGAVHCRNFAPLYGIDEEAATGTSNGALTYYLYNRQRIKSGEVNLFVQGEAMGKPSKVYTRLTLDEGKVKIRVGGTGAVNREIEV